MRFLAVGLLTTFNQSRLGPLEFWDVMISTRSPFFNFVSIGTSIQDGDILLYVKDDENLNAVYYFDSSCTAEASTEEENTYFVCDSFAEFWEQLDRE